MRAIAAHEDLNVDVLDAAISFLQLNGDLVVVLSESLQLDAAFNGAVLLSEATSEDGLETVLTHAAGVGLPEASEFGAG